MSDVADDAAVRVTEGHYEQVVSFQATNARRHRRDVRLMTTGLVSSIALNLMLGAGILAILPLKTFVPIFGFNNEAGLLDTTTEISDLPPSTQVADIEAVLWNYLRDREGFAASEADQNYDVVSRLSNDQVRTEYQKYANPKFNPQSPANVAGPLGFVRINRLGANFVRHADDYASGTYQIRFCRVIVRMNAPVVQQRLQANIGFERVTRVPLEQRITSNPAGVVVTEYPGPREDGAPGAANPCG